MDAELRFHFDERIAELMAQGETREAARMEATAEFGDVDSVRKRLHDIDNRIAVRRRRADWWEGATHDMRYVLRGLARSPGFTAMVVVTLALGIGANAAIYSVLDRLFVAAPVGVSNPDQVRRLYQNIQERDGRFARATFTFGEIRDLRAALPAGAVFAAENTDMVRLGRGSDAPKVAAVWVLGDEFALLGLKPLIGRFFTNDESRIDTFAPVAVISERLWNERYGGTTSALGQPLDIGSHRYTVIGVAPRGFRGIDLDAQDVWLPASTYISWTNRKPNWFYEHAWTGSMHVLTRVSSDAEARAFEAIATASLKRTGYVHDTTASAELGSVMEAVGRAKAGDSSMGIAARIAGVTVLVLVIACANIANLLLARGLRRRREIAVRLALGVSRRRLILQLLTESIVVAMMAGAVALLFTVWTTGALRSALLPNTEWGSSVVSIRMVFFVFASAGITGFASGILPALQVSDPDLAASLKEGGRTGFAQRSRTRAALLVVQAAFSVVLLAGAGVFIRSLDNVQAVDLGFDARRLLYASVSSDEDESHAAELSATLPLVMDRVRRMPGVEMATLVENIPMTSFTVSELFFAGRDSVPTLNGEWPLMTPVTPTFFGVTGMRFLAGRGFTDADRDGAPRVVIVNESMARTIWPGESALGKCFVIGKRTDPCSEIVGIVRDAHTMAIVEKQKMNYYVPLAQSKASATVLMVRVAPDRANVVAADTKSILTKSLGAWAIPRVRSMDEILASELRPYRLGASLFSAAAILALLVAAVGVYSSIAYSISQRTYEMGIRIALGARAAQIVRLVIGEGLRVVLLGVALGTLIALAAGRLIASLLYGTTPHDPAVLATVTILLVVVAVVAALVPALRATRCDPATALRAD